MAVLAAAAIEAECLRACGKTDDHDEFNPLDIDATRRQALLDRVLEVVRWRRAVEQRHLALVMPVSATT
jgi:hypothetical protein